MEEKTERKFVRWKLSLAGWRQEY